MRKLLIVVFVITAFGVLFFSKKGRTVKNVAVSYISRPSLINTEGTNVSSRILIPNNFKRTVYSEGSFQEYLRNYKLLPSGSKVINYNKEPYFYQKGHVGVLDISVPENGLQQCADALMRIRAEYLWDTGQKDKIGFNFTSGDHCSWSMYSKGFRPKVNGNNVSFHRTASEDTSKNNFYRYLNLIFMYSGTQSLFDELDQINSISELQIGDLLIYPGSPGHVIMIIDEIINSNGDKLFIFAQGNTPAQSVHILKNPNNLRMSPWYDVDIGEYLEISTYYFNEVKFIRFKDL